MSIETDAMNKAEQNSVLPSRVITLGCENIMRRGALATHRDIMWQLGIPETAYAPLWGAASADSNRIMYVVRCSDQQLTALVLMGAVLVPAMDTIVRKQKETNEQPN